MLAKPKIAFRNRNQTGWWVFHEVEQWVSDRQKKLSARSRCSVYVNLRLIKATTREAAYKKAMRLCSRHMPSRTNGGEWRFVGISMLLPVYDAIEDGSELLWMDKGQMTVKAIRALVKTEAELPVFDDTET